MERHIKTFLNIEKLGNLMNSYKLITFLSLLGISRLAHSFLSKFSNVAKESLRPKRDLIKRYGLGWCVIANVSEERSLSMAYAKVLGQLGFRICLLGNDSDELKECADVLNSQLLSDALVLCTNSQQWEETLSKLTKLDIAIFVNVLDHSQQFTSTLPLPTSNEEDKEENEKNEEPEENGNWNKETVRQLSCLECLKFVQLTRTVVGRMKQRGIKSAFLCVNQNNAHHQMWLPLYSANIAFRKTLFYSLSFEFSNEYYDYWNKYSDTQSISLSKNKFFKKTVGTLHDNRIDFLFINAGKLRNPEERTILSIDYEDLANSHLKKLGFENQDESHWKTQLEEVIFHNKLLNTVRTAITH